MLALGKLEGLLWLHEGPGSPVLTWWVRTGPVLVCASWATGQCLSKPSEWPPDLVFLSACLPLFSKGIFLKLHLFLSLITLVSGSSNSQLFLLLSDWIVKRAGVLQKRYLPFIICKLPSGYQVGVYGFKFIRAIEQSFVMCITWGEEKHLKV